MECRCRPFAQAFDCAVHPSRLAELQRCDVDELDANRDPGDETDA
jgi:hypothetical protein